MCCVAVLDTLITLGNTCMDSVARNVSVPGSIVYCLCRPGMFTSTGSARTTHPPPPQFTLKSVCTCTYQLSHGLTTDCNTLCVHVLHAPTLRPPHPPQRTRQLCMHAVNCIQQALLHQFIPKWVSFFSFLFFLPFELGH